MPKEINIREIKKENREERATIVIPGSKSRPDPGSARSNEETARSEPTQSFISRFLDIMVCDIMQKLRIPLKPFQEDLVRKQKDFEKFEEFCERARGGNR